MTAPLTLVESLRRAASSELGVTFDDGLVRYRDIFERAQRAAAVLAARGVRPGERVGLVLPTGVAFYDAFFGCVLCGAVPVPLYPPMRLGKLDAYHERTASMLRAVDARLVVTDKRIVRVLGETLAKAQPPLGWIEAGALLGEATLCNAVADNALAFIQFSSGTTGTPKPIRLTHAQILTNVHAILAPIDAAYPDIAHACVSWLPLYHDMGLIGCVLAAMTRPGNLTLLAPERFVTEPARWLRAMADTRASISAAPNFAYALCAERIRDDELTGVDLSSWRVALNGAEPVAPRVLDRFIERFAPFGFRPEALTPVYGLAEATLAVSFSTVNARYRTLAFDAAALAADGIARPGDGITLVNLGKAVDGIELRVDAKADVGPIQIRGASVTDGYLGEPDRPAGAWLDTGDTGFVYDGDLYVYGRTKDMIVVRGRKYAPSDIEHAASTVAGVRTGCVAAVGLRGIEGEELTVFVERARAAAGVDAALVQKAVVAATGLTPAKVIVLAPGTLPRTSSGKIARNETVMLYESGKLVPPRKVTFVRLAAAMLRSKLAIWRMR